MEKQKGRTEEFLGATAASSPWMVEVVGIVSDDRRCWGRVGRWWKCHAEGGGLHGRLADCHREDKRRDIHVGDRGEIASLMAL